MLLSQPILRWFDLHLRNSSQIGYQSRVKQGNMEQASAPLYTAAIDKQEMAVKQQQYFWNLKPVEILAWAKKRQPELSLLTGMTLASILISGAAIAVLLNPNLGQTLTYKPLIDDETLAASHRISLGEQLLGQVARVLEIEIIETQGPEIGRHSAAAPAMTIVAQADKAAPMPEADLTVGLKVMVVAAGAGLGFTGLMRLVPLIPFSALGPQRRQPLSQRLRPSNGSSQPLAPVSSRSSGPNQTLIPGALTSLAVTTSWSERRDDYHANNDHASMHPHASPRRRSRTREKPQQHRSRRKALRRHFVQTTQSAQGSTGGLRPMALETTNGAAQPDRVQEAGAQPKQRSQSSRQPVSFVTLDTFSKASLPPGQSSSPARPTMLWPSPTTKETGTPATSTPTAFDFLDELDIRRQYPLNNKN